MTKTEEKRTTMHIIRDLYYIQEELDDIKFGSIGFKNEEDQKARIKFLKSEKKLIDDEIKAKSSSIYHAIRWQESKELALAMALADAKKEVNRLKRRQNTFENTKTHLNFLLVNIVNANGREFKGKMVYELPEVTLSLGQTRGKLVIKDDAEIPKEFIKTQTVESIDKAGITKSINSGETYTGISIEKKQKVNIR